MFGAPSVPVDRISWLDHERTTLRGRGSYNDLGNRRLSYRLAVRLSGEWPVYGAIDDYLANVTVHIYPNDLFASIVNHSLRHFMHGILWFRFSNIPESENSKDNNRAEHVVK